MQDWKDLAVVLCSALIVLGATALAVSAQNFSVIRGQVLEKGIGVLKFEDKQRLTNTITVLIEDDDRVFDIKRGTAVQYPVSEHDAQGIAVGSRVKLMVSSYNPNVRILDYG
jgi:hypothetical protein